MALLYRQEIREKEKDGNTIIHEEEEDEDTMVSMQKSSQESTLATIWSFVTFVCSSRPYSKPSLLLFSALLMPMVAFVYFVMNVNGGSIVLGEDAIIHYSFLSFSSHSLLLCLVMVLMMRMVMRSILISISAISASCSFDSYTPYFPSPCLSFTIPVTAVLCYVR
jgi:hypothetical protein